MKNTWGQFKRNPLGGKVKTNLSKSHYYGRLERKQTLQRLPLANNARVARVEQHISDTFYSAVFSRLETQLKINVSTQTMKQPSL